MCALSWMQGGYWVSSLCLIPHIVYIVLSYKLIIRYHFQCPHPNPSHCEGFCTTFSKSFASYQSSDSVLSVRPHILEVELDLAEMACVSPNVHTTRSESFASFGSNVPFLSARSHILVVELEKAETRNFALWSSASRNVRRTLHVPSVVSVQWFVSNRLFSYPSSWVRKSIGSSLSCFVRTVF